MKKRILLPVLALLFSVAFSANTQAQEHDLSTAIGYLRAIGAEHQQISEDMLSNTETDVQALTDSHIGKVDALVNAKEKDIMTV